VFFGDEICCSNVTCWETSLAPVAKKVRKLLPDAVIYTNECAEKGIKEVPPDFDLISVDTCSSLFFLLGTVCSRNWRGLNSFCCCCADNGYSPGSKGTDEVTQAQAMYNNILFPKLHDHQQVLLVPGTFACSNLTYFALDDQAKNVVDKMEGYFKWAKAEKRIAGFNPWSAHLCLLCACA